MFPARDYLRSPRSTPWRTEERYKRFSASGYHVVVGNPPYITVRDRLRTGLPATLHDMPPEVLSRRAIHPAILGTC